MRKLKRGSLARSQYIFCLEAKAYAAMKDRRAPAKFF